MSKDKKDKVSLLGYDPIETPEEIISSDKNSDRKDAFKEAYKVVMKIIPDYFLTKKQKKTSTSSSGGNSFTQNIIVTSENVKIETNEKVNFEEKNEERERE